MKPTTAHNHATHPYGRPHTAAAIGTLRQRPLLRSPLSAPQSPLRHPRSALAMTYLDMVVSLVVIALLLGAFISVSNALVHDSSGRQTLATLQTLQRGLTRYHQTHHTWPSATQPRHIDTPMARCIAALRSSPASAPLIADLPGLTATPDGWFTVRDGFGQPMLYLHPGNPADATAAAWLQRLPRSPNGQPFIASAGPDARFGDLSSNDPAQRALSSDNLYSFDLEAIR